MMIHDGLLTLTVLASGSSGNAAVVHGTGGAILLDAGISAKRIIAGMEAAGIDPESLDAAFITHDHGDHIKGVRVTAKRLGLPVYMTEGTAIGAGPQLEHTDVRIVRCGDSLSIGGIGVRVFAVEHDVAEPVGYAFEDSLGSHVGVVTDTGRLTPQAADALRDCEILGIECNHDVDTLSNGPYPWFLKERILSSHGHLSNDSAAEAISKLAGGRLRHVVALHLSDTNNTGRMAQEAVVAALAEAGIDAKTTVCVQGLDASPVDCRR